MSSVSRVKDKIPTDSLVWVLIGKTQHAATALNIINGKVEVRWQTTSQTEWVDEHQVSSQLSRRRKQVVDYSEIKLTQKALTTATIPTEMHKRHLAEALGKPLPTEEDDEIVKADDNSHTTGGGGGEPPRKKGRLAKTTATQNLKKIAEALSPTILPDVQTEPSKDDDDDDYENAPDANDDDMLDDSFHDDTSVLKGKKSAGRSKGQQKNAGAKTKAKVKNFNKAAYVPTKNPPVDTDSFEESNTDISILSDKNTRGITRSTSASTAAQMRLQIAKTQNENADNVELDPVETIAENFTSSAYVQNLAEISHYILTDERWRCGGEKRLPLFSWERGDDLCALKAFADVYEPVTIEHDIGHVCNCLLCRSEQKPEVVDDNKGSPNKDDEANFSKPKAVPKTATSNEQLNRALYLYSRLFYRKGPWFRLDDIYKRYYMPKNSDQPRQSGVARLYTANNKEQFNLEVHRACLIRMIDDICALVSYGLIRRFHDEEECGKEVGLHVLNKDEEWSILSSLGGKKPESGKKVKKKKSGISIGSRQENHIWKQMSSQTSLHSHFTGSGGKKTELLPVLNHVNDLLSLKLSNAVEERTGDVNCTKKEAKQQFELSFRTFVTAIFNNASETPILCFRLREEPLLTLTRCARLFLCASAGPGVMRSNGSNGWKSLQFRRRNLNFETSLSIPGIGSWFTVQYPGLMLRFGLRSHMFYNSFVHITDPTRIDCQIFRNHHSFTLWEMCAEIRANIDFLIELDEVTRQGLQGASTDDKLQTKNLSVDFMLILNQAERERIIDIFFSSMAPLNVSISMFKRALHYEIEEVSRVLTGSIEQVICSFGIVAARVLSHSYPSNNTNSHSKPWLRHLSWESCLAFILWDSIPFFERNGMYDHAVRFLNVLAFGAGCDEAPKLKDARDPVNFRSLLSRRTRSKVFERYVIDESHRLRATLKFNLEELPKSEIESARKTGKEDLKQFCKYIVSRSAPHASLSFGTIRFLAKRLDQPLSVTLSHCSCLEANLLGLKYGTLENTDKYSDWTPKMDYCAANPLTPGESKRKRGSYVGFENKSVVELKSLNVESLALEHYADGNNFTTMHDERSTGGGWIGWHDEGGNVRALFRIICSGPLIGADWGCSTLRNMNLKDCNSRLLTLYLSPFQSSSFDLHVGHEVYDFESVNKGGEECPSFYNRQEIKIKRFLSLLSELEGQDLANCVYDAVKSRFDFVRRYKLKDPVVIRDVQNVRTLSMLAAGIGGKALASIFCCMLFDYRHYSGGLPDLTLVRAKYGDDKAELVDFGTWVGESFEKANQDDHFAKSRMSIVGDDEFLGYDTASVVGKSQAGSDKINTDQDVLTIEMPERLSFTHDGKEVKAECMFVEVKSTNDRLDPRQEDWLNVIDGYGLARVCKFGSTTSTPPKSGKK